MYLSKALGDDCFYINSGFDTLLTHLLVTLTLSGMKQGYVKLRISVFITSLLSGRRYEKVTEKIQNHTIISSDGSSPW